MSKYLVFLGLFLLLTVVFYLLQSSDPGFRFGLLMTGNGIMAALSILTCYMVQQQLNKRPEAFVRGVYSATLLKLMVCMTAILAYVLISRPDVHKPSLFILLGIYAIYTGVETVLLSRQARQAK